MQMIDENTVDVRHQARDAQSVIFDCENNTGLRVMFVGNSITYHQAAPALGWSGHWGMSASAEDKDYVHLCMAQISKWEPDAAFCICKGGVWEQNYINGEQVFSRYEAARDFGADIIIMRVVENCKKDNYDKKCFMEQYGAYMDYLDPAGKAKFILTTSFWRHPADEAIRAVAAERGAALCELSDLGQLPEMKAYGLFEHSGVACHPGDLGMQNIAERICQKLQPIIEK